MGLVRLLAVNLEMSPVASAVLAVVDGLHDIALGVVQGSQELVDILEVGRYPAVDGLIRIDIKLDLIIAGADERQIIASESDILVLRHCSESEGEVEYNLVAVLRDGEALLYVVGIVLTLGEVIALYGNGGDMSLLYGERLDFDVKGGRSAVQGHLCGNLHVVVGDDFPDVLVFGLELIVVDNANLAEFIRQHVGNKSAVRKLYCECIGPVNVLGTELDLILLVGNLVRSGIGDENCGAVHTVPISILEAVLDFDIVMDELLGILGILYH